MEKRIKLTIEYTAPNKGGLSDSNLTAVHQEVFESDPGEFVKYLLGRKQADVVYGFTTEDDHDFECDDYYYAKEFPSDICRKFGALCCNQLCPHLK